jgi:hypothetical protein
MRREKQLDLPRPDSELVEGWEKEPSTYTLLTQVDYLHGFHRCVTHERKVGSRKEKERKNNTSCDTPTNKLFVWQQWVVTLVQYPTISQ